MKELVLSVKSSTSETFLYIVSMFSFKVDVCVCERWFQRVWKDDSVVDTVCSCRSSIASTLLGPNSITLVLGNLRPSSGLHRQCMNTGAYIPESKTTTILIKKILIEKN